MKPRVMLVALAALVLGGCSAGEELQHIELPQTPVLSVRESWGVVEAPYIRVYHAPEEEARIVGHLRSGVVAEITGRVVSPVGGGQEGWVQVRQEGLLGWVDRQEIDLFDTRERAENAARAIRGD